MMVEGGRYAGIPGLWSIKYFQTNPRQFKLFQTYSYTNWFLRIYKLRTLTAVSQPYWRPNTVTMSDIVKYSGKVKSPNSTIKSDL